MFRLSSRRSRLMIFGLIGMSSVVAFALPVHAQAFNYPSLQVPTASTRDYTAALTGGAGTTVLFQWREGWGEQRHVQLDVGLADRKGSETLMLLVGGFVGRELLRATGDQPLDLLFTAGAGAAFGSGVTLFRVPVGVSMGHTFALEQEMSLTPYVHPRASVDFCSSCGPRRRGRTEVSLNFDLGVSFQVNREFALRAAGSFSGSDLLGTEDTFAVGFNWTPRPLVRTRGQ
jgi:hypothetical protein